MQGNERQVTGVDVDKLEVVGFGCDIAKEESIRWTFQEIIHHYGRLDSVVASAGEFFILPSNTHTFIKYKL